MPIGIVSMPIQTNGNTSNCVGQRSPSTTIQLQNKRGEIARVKKIHKNHK